MPALATTTTPESSDPYLTLVSAFQSLSHDAAANDSGRPHPDRTPRPGNARKSGRDQEVLDRADRDENSRGSSLYLTPVEAARELSVSPDTLARWRSKGDGPVYRLIGRRVVYPRASLAEFGVEIRGGCKRARPAMQITARVHSTGKIQIDMLFPAPMKRARIFAPTGLDIAAATAWGHKEADKRWRAFMKDAAIASVDSQETTATKQPKAAKSGAPTIGEYWPTFESDYVSTLKPASRAHYEDVWTLHLRSIVQDCPLDKCDREVFSAVKTACRKKGHAPAMVNHVISKLRRCLSHAEENGRIATECVPRVKVEKILDRHIEVYSRDDLRKILDTAKTHDDHPTSRFGKTRGIEGYVLACLLVYAGLRIGEAAGLYWTDLDFARGTMTIQRNMCKCIQQTSPKGEIGTITLHPVLVAALLAWRDDCPAGARVLSYTDRSAAASVTRWQSWAGLPAHGPHRIRHSVLTHMVERGLDVHALKNFARHSKIQTTMRYYAHADKVRATARAVATMDYSDGPENATAVTAIIESGPSMAMDVSSPEFLH